MNEGRTVQITMFEGCPMKTTASMLRMENKSLCSSSKYCDPQPKSYEF